MKLVPGAPKPTKVDGNVEAPLRLNSPRPSGPVATPLAHPKLLGQVPSTPASDPFPIGQTKALALTLGIPQQFHSRIPTNHLSALKKIRAMRPELLRLSDAQLTERFQKLGQRLRAGEPRARLMIPALAIAREVSRRTIQKEPYEVQLLGAMAIANRNVADLKMGEGKTIAGALAASLLALEQKGCHVVTTNGYLAARDAELLRPFYTGLGLTVGVTKSMGMGYDEKREAYKADITYGHCDTFAFDWLEDQVWWRKDWRVQRGLAFAIVDEADDVLLDMAQQPLVLCGAPEGDDHFSARKELLRTANQIVQAIDPAQHLTIYFEREKRRPMLNTAGFDALERAIAEQLNIPATPESIWSGQHNALIFQVMKALEARHSVALDKDYIESSEGLTLVSSTGHPSPGARLRHGLMDAVLLARNAEAQPELGTIGMISYQSFFNMYGQLSGITGTTRGAKEELREMYRLPSIEVPTHKPVSRVDEPDRYFPHPAPRLLSAVADIAASQARGQPVLVSTISVAASLHVSRRLADPLLTFVDVAVSSRPLFEQIAGQLQGGAALVASLAKAPGLEAQGPALKALLEADLAGQAQVAAFLDDRGLPASALLAVKDGVVHRTLNAQTHQQEADIYAGAGQVGAVTVATQMAGRGVDIPVSQEAQDRGGLRVVGIEHKSNRRKDDQARGRAGRQGEPGSSIFYVSPADEVFSFLPAHLLRKLCTMLPADRIAAPEGALKRAWDSAVDGAQRRAEINGEADRRRNVKMDGVLEIQRRFLTGVREEILEEPGLAEHVVAWAQEALQAALQGAADPLAVSREWMLRVDPQASELQLGLASNEQLHARFGTVLKRRVAATMATHQQDEPAFNQYLRDMILFNLDQAWINHLQDQEWNKSTAYLAAYGERDPFLEHTKNASNDFRALEKQVRQVVVDRYLHHLSGQ